MRKSLILLALLLCGLSSYCRNAETERRADRKGSSRMFETKGVCYPVRFADYQRNSFVPFEPRVAGTVAWSKGWFEINPRLQIIPQDLLLSGRFLGVRGGTVLLLLDDRGAFVRSVALGENTPVVFGEKTFAYLNQSFLLEYMDYDGTLRLEMKEFPAMEAFTRLVLFRPTEDDFLAATHFTGGPRRETPHFDLYRMKIDKVDRQWSYAGDGGLDQALLTSDEKTLVVVRENQVTTFNAENGEIVGVFDTGYAEVLSASLDLDGNVVMIGRADSTGWVLKKTDLAGREIWAHKLSGPKPFQPPVCGPDDRVYVADGVNVTCLAGGKAIWERVFPGGHPLMTIGAGNAAVVLDGGTLYVLDAAGETVARLVLTESAETFDAAPAIDTDGRIFVAGSERLYGVE
jgi:hypothetical protein